MPWKKIIGVGVALGFLGIATLAVTVIVVNSNLPQLITVEDYSPLLSSEVYDRKGQKIGEFLRERRVLVPADQIPDVVKQAFVSGEDASFYEHGGVNYVAILRAMLANIKAGRKVQGASTITQQVARTLLLTRKKTYTRKIKEILLAYRMEENLSKEDILFLYLNQIYLGHGAYGVGAATKIYFRKDIKDITLSEAAILAGLPKAPGRYSPLINPKRAKERQLYVLKRMAEEEVITEDQAQMAGDEPLQVYLREDYKDMAPFYLETIRQLLVKELGEEWVLDRGIRVYTGLDLEKQLEAQKQLKSGLRDLDKRQGFRGPLKHLEEPAEIAEFLLKTRNQLIENMTPVRVLQPDGSINEYGPLNLTGYAPDKEEAEGTEDKDDTAKTAFKEEERVKLPNIPEYVNVDEIVEGIVINVDDKWGLVTVRFAESRGMIDLESMEWARQPDSTVNFKWARKIKTPSTVLKKGDIILVRVAGKKFRSKRIGEMLTDLKKEFRKKNRNKKKKEKFERPEDLPEFVDFARLELEQEPAAEAALLSLDEKTEEIIALVGGYDFKRSKFNRAIQAARQTGSSFKALVYMAALDKGFNPASQIIDAPVVFEEEEAEGQLTEGEETKKTDGESEPHVTKWKPMNHSKKFVGELLFKNALIRSLNVPTVKIMEKIGVPWVVDYARRLGILSPLNMDYTLALGSSSVTLYEITKAFAQIGNSGKRISPILIHKVEDKDGKILLNKVTMDDRFRQEVDALNEEFEARRLAYLEFEKNSEKFQSNKEAEEKVEREGATQEDGENKEKVADIGEAQRKRNMRKEPPIFFKDPDQLIKPTTAYITTNILRGVVEEKKGTGRGAKALGRPVAGKTGTTNGYYDAWFVGFTPQIATGVWVGFDNEKSLGAGEVGGRAALPIWVKFMKVAHEGLPTRNFKVPEGIIFANIDNETGKLASADSKDVVRQAFVEGTEPSEVSGESSDDDDQDFYKQDLSE